MTEPAVETPKLQTDPPKNTSLFVGTALFILAWLLATSLCGISTFVIFANQGAGFLLAFGCILVFGPAVALLLGLVFAPKWWPGFYTWIENHPALVAILPGGISAIIFAELAIWTAAILSDLGSSQAGATLAAMFILSPAALIVGPLVGSVGGLLAAVIGRRVTVKPHNLIFGTLGGAIAGLVIGAGPFIVLGLMDRLR